MRNSLFKLLVFSLLATSCSLLVSCGFHLRGMGKAEFPPELMQLRVSLDGDESVHAPVLTVMKQTLQIMAGVTLVEGSGTETPHLMLSGERFDSQVLSVGSNVKINEYLLRYEISYQLLDAAGGDLSERKTIKLQRDYTYDPLNILAKEKEEAELRELLRRDAAQQIVRRLARITFTDVNGGDHADQRRPAR